MKLKDSEFSHLEFKLKQIEDYDNFIKNQKYIQVCQKYNYTIIDIVIYREDYENNYFSYSFSLYTHIQRYESDEYICNYYEIVSNKKKIQETMEYRALNLILQKIIGDKMFQW
jgi:hypothetical protein